MCHRSGLDLKEIRPFYLYPSTQPLLFFARTGALLLSHRYAYMHMCSYISEPITGSCNAFNPSGTLICLPLCRSPPTTRCPQGVHLTITVSCTAIQSSSPSRHDWCPRDHKVTVDPDHRAYGIAQDESNWCKDRFDAPNVVTKLTCRLSRFGKFIISTGSAASTSKFERTRKDLLIVRQPKIFSLDL